MLKKLLEQFGFSNVQTYVSSDGHAGLKQVVEEALKTCQLVLSTGGVSMGEYNFILLNNLEFM